MKIFGPLYDKVMDWSRHPKAPWFLGGLSFAESSFFPIPPDVMLMPMAMAAPRKAWSLALITTITSVLGGLLGYLIGSFLFDAITPLLHDFGYWQPFEKAKSWFHQWGFWVIFLAGFSPIPYKVFTIAAGVVSMSLLPFIIASIIGRGARFFLVAGLMRWGGPRIEPVLRQHIDRIGWLVVVIVAIFIAIKAWT